MPELEDLLATADSLLIDASRILAADIPASAAREAYLAALNAGRAVIFDKTRRVPKTHVGTKTALHRLANEGVPFPRELLEFLKDGFDLKSDADYGSRKLADRKAARDAIVIATAFVAHCKIIVHGE